MTELQDRARDKFRLAPRLFFTKEALEQSSGEIVAHYRARRFADSGPTADLCCGIGGDAMALASVTQTIAIDRDATRLACCRHNLAVSKPAHDCSLVLADVLEYPLLARTAFIDPSRREDGRRVKAGEDYSPPLSFALALSKKLDGLGAKAAPG
ncbi:MAG: trimethylguanosine synthase, partial [Chloroflexi bacterium]|nr:trimethylguanosine synthase [Chloroflexota bacterium]